MRVREALWGGHSWQQCLPSATRVAPFRARLCGRVECSFGARVPRTARRSADTHQFVPLDTAQQPTSTAVQTPASQDLFQKGPASESKKTPYVGKTAIADRSHAGNRTDGDAFACY